jgi:DnaJ-class molecular chaperone
VVTGQRIRVKGQGGASPSGGPAGDVYLVVNVLPDSRFERDGANLKTRVDVGLYDALLGGEVTVPTPTGRVALTIPAGTQNGKVFRLRNQGMPKLKASGERGDLLATVNVLLPTELSDEEREKIEELRHLRS